jgi:hypothetical protein
VEAPASSRSNTLIATLDPLLDVELTLRKAVPACTQGVAPILDCVTNNKNGTYTASFGYTNSNATSVTISVGSSNYFSPYPQNQGQPTTFLSGTHHSVFNVVFNGSNLTWYLKGPDSTGRSVTVSKSSPACTNTPPKITASASPTANANGWNNSNVTITFTCTAGSYPIKSCSSPVVVSKEGASQVIAGTVTDTSGQSASASVTVSLDKTLPTITAAVTPAPVGGINYGSATVTFTCSDALSGIAICPSPITVKTIGANQKISGTATDKAGNSSSTSVTLNIQPLAPPTITASASPLPNANGWNNSNVTVTFTCKAGSYPIKTCPAAVVVSAEGANQSISGTTTDTSGATATASVNVSLDETLPTITTAITPPPVGGISYGSATVTFTCSDTLSGVATCPSPITDTTIGANQKISGTATDKAGNSNSTSVTLNIQQGVPVITWPTPAPIIYGTALSTTQLDATASVPGTFVYTPAAGTVLAAGSQLLSATFTPTDTTGYTTAKATVTLVVTQAAQTISFTPPVSPVIYGVAPIALTATASSGLPVTFSVVSGPGTVSGNTLTITGVGTVVVAANQAGNTNYAAAPQVTQPVVVTQAAQTISFTPPVSPVTYGVAPITLTATASSGLPVTFSIVSGPGTVNGNMLTITGAGTVMVAAEQAGNTNFAAAPQVTQPVVVSQAVLPTIVAIPSPAANANGWNNSNVTVNFTCTAGSYPIKICPIAIVVGTEGANQLVSGTTIDTIGATAPASVKVSLDKALPSLSASATTADGNPYTAGQWTGQSVTVVFVCTDAGSGVASFTQPVTLSSDGANQSVPGNCIDNADNAAPPVTFGPINIEKTLPTLAVSATTADGKPYTAGQWTNQSVTVTFYCTATGSGVKTVTSPITLVNDGVDQSATGDCMDNAGNAATPVTFSPIDIDKAGPTILQFTAPSQLSPGQSGAATLSVSDIAPVSSVVFQLNGTSIGTALTPPYTVDVIAPSTATSGSTLALTAVVTDIAGNVASPPTHGIQVVSSGVLVGQVLSDVTGLPLKDAILQVAGQASQSTTSDAQGRYSIPVTSNQLFLTISQPGNSGSIPAMVTVERQVSVQSGVGTVPLDARLTPIAAPVSITASGGTVGADPIMITVPAGGATTQFYLTPLSQQGLPGLLPLGWSPVASFDLQSDISSGASLSANFTGLPSVPLYLVNYSYNVHAWTMVTPNLYSSNGSLTVSLPSTGDYALVTPDAGNANILVPEVGQPLTGVQMVPLSTTATSTGSLSPANVAPTGGTSMASLAVQSSIPLPSGTVIQSEVTEKFTLASGKLISEEPRYEDILLYQTPAPSGAAVAATFPVTPSRTFPVAQLASGDVHLDILSGRESVRGETGGSDAVSVQSGDATLTVAAGSLSQDTVIAVNTEAVDTFLPSTNTLVPLSEYNVDFSGAILNTPAQLSVGVGAVAPGSNVVIAQVQRVQGVPFLVVVSMAQVTATNIVSQVTPGLPGITQGGDYVFYELTSPNGSGFVGGTISAIFNDGSFKPVAAMIQTDGLPFVAFSNSNGNYMTVAAAGTVNLTATIANTALAGTATTQVTAGQTATQNIIVTGQVESATITPANGAVGVPLTAEIDITAADAINPDTVTSSSVVLTAAGNNAPVSLRFVFSAGNTKLAVFPQTALQPSTQYTFQASGIANSFGGLISVPTISFTTVAITPPTYNTDALVFSMPDQNGNVQISAPANSFPPGTTILIVDQTNGVVYSLTVLNDGSVSGQMPATINDTLQVTLTDPSGNKTTFTISKFVAPDGTTAIGPGGGTVTGPGGTGIIIPQGALNQGVTFKLALLDQTAFPQLPSWPGVNFGSGIQITAPSMPSFNKEAKLVFPVPANAPEGAFYYVYRRLVDVNDPNNVLFETIDHAFVQGKGANAQVVTASPPFCGYMNSFGNFQQAAAASYNPMQAAVTVTFMLWDYDPLQAGWASQGVIVGRVFQSSSTGPGPLTNGTTVAISLTNNPQYVTTTSDACGTYSLFDPQRGGGQRSVTALNQATGQKIVAIADEVNGVQSDDGLFSVTAGLENQYRNIGRLNFTFAPPQPLPPPPQINIGISDASKTPPQTISGIVQAGTPLNITFTSSLTVQSATINGSQYPVTTDKQTTSSTLGSFHLSANPYVPSSLGVYTITASASPALGGGSPVTVSRSFLVVAAGGGNTYATNGVAPTVIASDPSPDANGLPIQNVPTSIFPEVTFNEPVTYIPGSVTLVGSPQGDMPKLLLIGTRADGTVVNLNNPPYNNPNVPYNDPKGIISLTIQPITGLEFGETYTLTLYSGIVNIGTDQGGNPIPQLPLSPAFTLQFSTFGPQQLGNTSSLNQVLTRPVIIGQRAYAGDYVNVVMGGLGMFDIGNPAKPKDLGVGAYFVGRVSDAAGLAKTPAIAQELQGSGTTWSGHPLVAVSASTAQDVEIPANVWLYDVSANVSNPKKLPVRVGAVSVTSSVRQAGFALRMAMKNQYLYTSTFLQGLQVIDLGQAIAEYQQVYIPNPAQFGEAVAIEGNGFAMDTIVNDIQLPVANPYASPPPCGTAGICGTATMWDLKADDFVTSGGVSGSSAATQTLLVATGNEQVPLVVADPSLSGMGAVLYPPSPDGIVLRQGPLQMQNQTQTTNMDGSVTTTTTTFQLIQGRAVALATIPVTDTSGNTTNQHIAVVVGTGTTSIGTSTTANGNTTTTPGTSSGGTLLAVVDMSQPYTPGSPFPVQVIGMLPLNANATDVTIYGTVALVATGTNVLLVNLENPSQPVFAGEITGNFGNWLAISSTGILIGSSPNSIGVNTAVLAPIAYVSDYNPSPIPLVVISPQPSNKNLMALSGDVLLTHVVVPADPSIVSDVVYITDDLGTKVASYDGTLKGGQGTVAWKKGATVDITRTYSAQVDARKNGKPVMTFPTLLTLDETCKVGVFPEIPAGDKEAQDFENGDHLNTDNLRPDTLAGYQCMQRELPAAGLPFLPTSAWRPPAYQWHLRQLYDLWNGTPGHPGLINNSNPACRALKTRVKADLDRHDLVHKPASACGPHPNGWAVDYSSGVPQSNPQLRNQVEDGINRVATGTCNLVRRVPDDTVHYEPPGFVAPTTCDYAP